MPVRKILLVPGFSAIFLAGQPHGSGQRANFLFSISLTQAGTVADVSAMAGSVLYDRRADKDPGVNPASGRPSNLPLQFPVHQRQLEFVVEIGDRAQAVTLGAFCCAAYSTDSPETDSTLTRGVSSRNTFFIMPIRFLIDSEPRGLARIDGDHDDDGIEEVKDTLTRSTWPLVRSGRRCRDRRRGKDLSGLVCMAVPLFGGNGHQADRLW